LLNPDPNNAAQSNVSTPETVAECLDCGHKERFKLTLEECPECGGQWLEARYDFDKLRKILPGLLSHRPFDLWRYAELLPVKDFHPELKLGEGGTPLIHAANLGLMLGCPNIFIKDERQGPTGSFKDRQAAVGVAALKEADITEMVLASTGNVAISYSAYAARAGVKLWAFLTSLVPTEKMREVSIYGTQVIKVTGSYDQTKQLAAQFADQRNLPLERGARSIPSVESMKTIAFEIVEQLTQRFGPISNGKASTWRAPDWYFQAISGGLGPIGVQKGFDELLQMGLTDKMPAIAGIQTEGCAPMAHAWKLGMENAEPVRSPRTHIATLSTGDPGRAYSLLRQRMLANGGGNIEQVTDEEAFRAMHILAKMEGISVEPAAAVAFAGLIKMARAGQIDSEDVVVINCSGHTMPIERAILGEGWTRSLTIPSQADLDSTTPQEGLLAALSRVTDDRYPRIAIVDDMEEARRLIRRILQTQGNYTIFEASNGEQAIKLARRELPDLILLDLMMPDIDGFQVLDALKSDPLTASIPVIVVTAKELTPYEKQRLKGNIYALMQKGEFMNDELLDEVRALVQ
jgi:threonine synthase